MVEHFFVLKYHDCPTVPICSLIILKKKDTSSITER